MTTDMIDFLCILAISTGTIIVRLIDYNFYTTSGATAFVATFFLHKNDENDEKWHAIDSKINLNLRRSYKVERFDIPRPSMATEFDTLW